MPLARIRRRSCNADACVLGGNFREVFCPAAPVASGNAFRVPSAVPRSKLTIRAPISFLRRMHVFPERELALAFLTSRRELEASSRGHKHELNARRQILGFGGYQSPPVTGDLHTVCYSRFCQCPHAPPNSIGLSLDALRSTLQRFPDALTLTALLRLSQLMYITVPLRSLLLAINGDAVRAHAYLMDSSG
jgi:hypothetical protein